MARRSLAAVILGMALTASVQAGGWAVITVDTLPDSIDVGKPTAIVFTVRAHGVTPVGGLSPWIEARAGDDAVTVRAQPGSRDGRYTAQLTLPRPADWVLTIHSGYASSRLTLAPIEARSAPTGPTTAAPTPMAAVGRRLFLAKGCVTCHQNSLGSPNESLSIGPALVPQKYQPEFLARILADPAGTLPPPREAMARMPNLELRPEEVASLVAFINAPAVTAGR